MRTTLGSTLRTYAFIVFVSTFMCSFSYAFLSFHIHHLIFIEMWALFNCTEFRFFHVCLACCSGWHMFVFFVLNLRGNTNACRSLAENRSTTIGLVAGVGPDCASMKNKFSSLLSKVDAVFEIEEKKNWNKMKQVWRVLRMIAVSQHLSNVYCMPFQYVQFFPNWN